MKPSCEVTEKYSRLRKLPLINTWSHYRRYVEEGRRACFGMKDAVMSSLYSSMLPANSWDPAASVTHTHHGAVFNLEFSPDGSMLVAACEKRSILVFDPLRGSLINHLDNAHNDCVNCVKFLDPRMFATCSDDNTVSIWDIRFLKNKIRCLKGHANWVKNIEYAHDVGLLVTSGFDGSVYTWDINRYSEGDILFKRVFHTNGLMRTKLSPDGSKLILCTNNGYIMVIHDLDLHALPKDLHSFKPNVYRFMQLNDTPIHLRYKYNHLFTAKRNRVELISDFPIGNDAEVISSLQVHPQGWCILSRNTSRDENTEWTCVHDIQDFPGSSADEADGTSTLEDDNAPDVDETKNNIVIDSGDSSLDASSSELSGDSSTNMYSRPVVHIRFNCTRRTPSGGSDEEDNDNDNNSSNNVAANQERRAVDVTFRLPMTSFEALEAVAATIASRQRNYNNNTNQGSSSQSNPLLTPRNDENGAESDVSQLSASRERTHNLDLDDSSLDPYSSSDHEDDAVHVDLRERATYFMRTGSQLAARTLLLLGSHRRNLDNNKESKSRLQKTPRSRPRLSHFIAEPNVGRGFIKELCFSTDGRLVCSPFGHGVRLLAFNPTCSELCDSVPDTPTKLYEIATNVCHPYVVVSTKFSPTHCLLVSGCLRGQICFHRPVIE